MKKFIVIFLFTKDSRKVLMVKRNTPPYKDCWNGIGGKIEGNETEIQASVKSNYEGIYEWKDIEFALDFNNKELAGLANISQFVKEIFDIERIKKFYE